MIVSAIKTGAFEVFELIGLRGEANNLGTGNFDVNSVAGMFGIRAQSGNQSSGTLTITNSFAVDTNTYNNTAVSNIATYTNYGGINIRFDNQTRAAITNMIGIKVNDPVNNTGATVTNSYVLYSDANTLASSNWGVYILGAGTGNYLQGNLRVGTTGTSLTSIGTVTKLITSESSTSTSSIALIGAELTITPSSNSTGYYRGISGAVIKQGSNNVSNIIGLQGYSRNSGGGNITSLIGTDSFAWSTAAASITDLFAYRASPQTQGGTITNFGGLQVVFGQTQVGTVTNMYGVHRRSCKQWCNRY